MSVVQVHSPPFLLSMRNNLYNLNVRLPLAILAALGLLSCGCSSLSNDSYTGESRALPTDKIKLYLLPDYAHLKNDSSQWKAYEELAGESIRFLGDEKGCIVTNAGYVGKEAAGKNNALTDVFSGAGLNLQEKNAVKFVNKEFPQGNKEDSLILCVYALPQYPGKEWGVVSPYPAPSAPLVYTMGISRLELGYVLIDPAKQGIIKRRKFIFSRKLDRGAGSSTFGTSWKFVEEQNDFFEKSVGKLFEGFPGRRLRRRVAEEPLVPELSSTTPLSGASIKAVEDTYTRLSRQRAEKKNYQIAIESIDGRQWRVNIDLKGTGDKKPGDNLSGGKPQGDWVDSLAKDGFFHGQVNKADLEQIIKTFLNWADDSAKAPSGTSSRAD